MPKQTPAIKLVARQGSVLEQHKRYAVMLNGKFYSEVYFNMRGYVGDLPTPEGARLSLPECSLTQFRREIAALNKEFKAKHTAP